MATINLGMSGVVSDDKPRKKTLKEITEKHRVGFYSENFKDWKTTEIIYCKIGWVIDALDGSEELEDQVNILLNIQSFIEDLQNSE